MKRSIHEANLGRDDTQIAELYLLERKAQVDTADCCGIDRKTLHRHLPFIFEKVEFTANKLGFLQKGTQRPQTSAGMSPGGSFFMRQYQ